MGVFLVPHQTNSTFIRMQDDLSQLCKPTLALPCKKIFSMVHSQRRSRLDDWTGQLEPCPLQTSRVYSLPQVTPA